MIRRDFLARTLSVAVASLVGSLALVPRLGTEFLPELNEGALWINMMLPPGISVSETSHQLSRIRARLDLASPRIPNSTG